MADVGLRLPHQDELARKFRAIGKRDLSRGRDTQSLEELRGTEHEYRQCYTGRCEDDGMLEIDFALERPPEFMIEETELHAVACAGHQVGDAVPVAVNKKM